MITPSPSFSSFSLCSPPPPSPLGSCTSATRPWPMLASTPAPLVLRVPSFPLQSVSTLPLVCSLHLFAFPYFFKIPSPSTFSSQFRLLLYRGQWPSIGLSDCAAHRTLCHPSLWALLLSDLHGLRWCLTPSKCHHFPYSLHPLFCHLFVNFQLYLMLSQLAF